MLHKVTSAANPTVKMLKALHAKKGRQESGLFLAEGARLTQEAADAGIWPEVMLVSDAILERPYAAKLVEGAQKAGARVIVASDAILSQIAKRENPQQILGAYKQRFATLDDLSSAEFAVALQEVRDPGNLGTIMRTSDAVGAAGIVLIGNSCDPFSVEAVRASMGSIFAVKLARASFDAFNAWRLREKFRLVGTSLNGVSPHESAFTKDRTIILMGNEQSGLPPAMETACDALARIPMRGSADSLNLAAATAIMLYEIWRGRGYDGARH